jgi:hypothetical protein
MQSEADREAARYFDAAVRFIASRPHGAERLLAQHKPDSHGRCCGCGEPGYGTPNLPWPCSIAKMAQAAKQI